MLVKVMRKHSTPTTRRQMFRQYLARGPQSGTVYIWHRKRTPQSAFQGQYYVRFIVVLFFSFLIFRPAERRISAIAGTEDKSKTETRMKRIVPNCIIQARTYIFNVASPGVAVSLLSYMRIPRCIIDQGRLREVK